MASILLTNHYTPSLLSIIEKEIPQGFNIISIENPTKEEIIKKAIDADYFLVGGRIKIDRDVIESAPGLKMIQRTGVGMDAIDLDVLKEKGIPVYVNYGVNSRSVAEHTILLMLSVLRRLPVVDSAVKAGIWKKHELGVQNGELYGKTVGLIGLGHIGTHVARMLQVFGVKTIYYKPSKLTHDEERELDVSYCPLGDLLGKSDIVSLHCPLNSKTEGMIGSDEMAVMKPGSIIINTSRGPLINEDALVKNLYAGHLKGAGLDVYATEPL